MIIVSLGVPLNIITMFKTTLVIGIVVLILNSCTNPDRFAPPPVEKSIVLLAEEEKPMPSNTEIGTYFKGEEDIPDYNKIAHIEVIGNDWFSKEQLINNLKYEAHKLGANALVNIEMGEKAMAVEWRRNQWDTINDNKEMLKARNVRFRQYISGLAVVMDEENVRYSTDSLASHLVYVKQERENRKKAEIQTQINKKNILNVGIGAAVLLTIVYVTITSS